MLRPFEEQFAEGFAMMVGDEELAPLREDFAPLAAHPVFPTHRMLPFDAMRRVDVETLLVVFHFSRNEYERLLAASQLKQREWRFNSQFKMWFKRAAQPQEQTADYERGDYHIFDWEERLAIKKITDLTIEYRFLEEAAKAPPAQ